MVLSLSNFLRGGASTEVKCSNGKTPLDLAAGMGYDSMVVLLSEKTAQSAAMETAHDTNLLDS